MDERDDVDPLTFTALHTMANDDKGHSYKTNIHDIFICIKKIFLHKELTFRLFFVHDKGKSNEGIN